MLYDILLLPGIFKTAITIPIIIIILTIFVIILLPLISFTDPGILVSKNI